MSDLFASVEHEIMKNETVWLAGTRLGMVSSKIRDEVSHALAHPESFRLRNLRLSIVAPSLVLLSRSSHVCMVGLFKALEALLRGFLHSLEDLS
jgi:hypothetical protein